MQLALPKIKLQNKFTITIINALYVPALSHSLFSIRYHMKYINCGYDCRNNKAFLEFPTFTVSADVSNAITINISTSKDISSFDMSSAPLCPPITTPHAHLVNSPSSSIIDEWIYKQPSTDNSNNSTPSHIPIIPPFTKITPKHSNDQPTISTTETKHTTTTQSLPPTPSPIDHTSPHTTPIIPNPTNTTPIFSNPLDPILPLLSPPTPSSSDINLPKWLQNNTKITIQLPNQKRFTKGIILFRNNHFLLKHTSTNEKTKLTPLQLHHILRHNLILQGHQHHIQSPSKPTSSPPNLLHQINPTPTPELTQNKPLSSWPKTTSFIFDQLKQNFGFRLISHIIKEIKQVSERNFHISSPDPEPITSLGDVAAIPTPKRNHNSLSLPLKFGDIFHMDIVFGSKTAIGGIKYGLFLIDRATRYKIILPLKNLKTDIPTVLLKLKHTLHIFPKRIITDYDHKLIGDKIQHFLIDNHIDCKIEAAPPKRQNQNGLSESNWKTVLKMARVWIANKFMPSTFWWYALRHAVMISNYLPIMINNILTTPYYLIHHKRPDLRNLIPLFSVGYITKYKDVTTSRRNIDSHSIRVILIGKNTKSNSLIFYHPPTQKVLAPDSYRLDETLPTGPVFHLEFDGGLHFNRYTNFSDMIRPPTYHPQQIIYLKHNNDYIKSKVIVLPSTDSDIYTIQLLHDLSIQQRPESSLLPSHPDTDPSSHNPPLPTFPKWIQNESKATLFLSNMQKPKHGYILHYHNEYYFRHGSKSNDPYTHLPDFESTAYELINSKQLFPGHPKYKPLIEGRINTILSDTIANHISAAGLTSEDVPSLIDHYKLHPTDQKIWKSAYSEEYFGLYDLPTWITITDSQYHQIRHLCPQILPSMAISTIKYDQDGKPKRAKYRIVVLGNFDPHNWSKSDVYSPVISLMHLRLLITIAVKRNRIVKQGDVKQAFVQSYLPPHEKYVIRPPAGCPYSKPNTYWLLLRTLNGLKRSGRHWFEKVTKIFASIGLLPCPNAPCLFSQTTHLPWHLC